MPRADQQQALETILRNPAVWRAEPAQATRQSIATTYPALDQALPERGWPVGVLTELLVRETGTGELALLMPALRALCTEGRGIALLGPP
jgi:protein ImuA